MTSKDEADRSRIGLNSNLSSPKDEPLSIDCGGGPPSTTPSSLLSTTSPLSSWMNDNNGTEETEFGSTLDVDAIKRSPSNILGVDDRCESRKNSKPPLVTIPENWDSIDVNSAKNSKNPENSDISEDEESEDDSEDSVSSCSHSDSESGSECSGTGSSSTCSSDEDSSSSSYCSDQHCSSKQKSVSSKSSRRHRQTPNKSGRKSKTVETSAGSTTTNSAAMTSQFFIDSSLRGPSSKHNSKDVTVDEFLTFNPTTTSGHQVTTVVGTPAASSSTVFDSLIPKSVVNSVTSSSCVANSASGYSQAESLFNAISTSSSSFSKPFPPSKGASITTLSGVTARFRATDRTKVVTSQIDQPPKLLPSSLATRKFFKSEKKAETSRVGQSSGGGGSSSYRHTVHSQSTHFQTSISNNSNSGSAGSSHSHVESLCEKGDVEIAHLDEQLEHFGKEGSAGTDVALHSIAGGLQVIEDADLVAILKDVSSEADHSGSFVSHLGVGAEDDEDTSCSSEADFTTRGTSMSGAGGASDSVSEAISRMALQAQDQRSKWNSSSGGGLNAGSNLGGAYRPSYSLSPFVAKSSSSGSSATTATNSCDIRGIKYSDSLAPSSSSFSRARHYSGKKRKSRTSVKSRMMASSTSTSMATSLAQHPNSSPYSQPPTLQPHFAHQALSPHNNVPMLSQQQPKAPPQLVHHQLQQQQDLDLYLNSSASNVSPDSGIQSEGGVNNSSPLHLGDIPLPSSSTSTAVSTILTTTNQQQNYVQTQQQHVLYHSPQLGQTFSTGTQSWNQSTSYYGSYVSPSYQSTSHLHNPTYVYPTGHTPVSATLVVTTESVSQAPPSLHPQSQYFSQKSPVFRVNRQKSPTTSQHSSSSGGDRKVKRGRGRPKGSKNKVPKKMTMDCGSQTIESSLETVATNSTTNSVITSSINNHSRGISSSSSSSNSCHSDSDSSAGSLPPPLPVFMGSALTEPSKIVRGRPRKDPPRLVPEVTPHSLPPPPPPPPLLTPVQSTSATTILSPRKIIKSTKEKVISLSPRIRTISALPLKTSCEVIMLDSDDSTVFSDNNDDDDDDDEDDEDEVDVKVKVIEKVKEKTEEKIVPPSSLPPRLQPVISAIVQPLKANRSEDRRPVMEKKFVISPSTSPSGSDHEYMPARCASPAPPVLVVAATSTTTREPSATPTTTPPPPLTTTLTISKPKKHHRSEEERSRKRSKHKSKRKQAKKEKRRHRRKSDSPPKIDRQSSISPIRIKSKSIKISPPEVATVPPLRIVAPVIPSKPKEDLAPKKVDKPEKPVESNTTTKVSSFSKGDLVPVFDAKYCSLKPEQFWKQNGTSKKVSSTKSAREHKRSASLTTKAAVKEVPASPVPPAVVGGSAVKTMLQVLATASKRGKPGRKPKRDRKSSEWADSKIGVSPGSSCHSSKSPFSPQSVASGGGESLNAAPIYTHVQESAVGYKKKKEKRKKKKKKSDGAVWRSKHKNVIDPVLLGEVEQLIQDLVNLQVSSKMSKDYWPDRPRDSVPSIFRRRKILVGRAAKTQVLSQSDKPPAKRGRPKKNSQPSTGAEGMTSSKKSSASTSSAFDALLASSDPAEQRLPLKKRYHHHIQKDNCNWDSESGNSSSGCCATSPPIKPSPAVQRRASVQSRNEASSKGSGRSSRKPSVEDSTQRNVRGTGEEKVDRESSKSRIRILEERCESILKENNKSKRTLSDELKSSSSKPPPLIPEVEKPPSNIVDSIAACIDKYTGGKSVNKKYLSQKLTVQTSSSTGPSVAQAQSKSSLTSPRKRHLLELREREERESVIRYSSPPPLLPSIVSETQQNNSSWSESLPPPLLEKVTTHSDENRDSEKVNNKVSKKSPLSINIERFSSDVELEAPPLLSAVHSPPRLSQPHNSAPDTITVRTEEERCQPNLLIAANLLEKVSEDNLASNSAAKPQKRRGRPPLKKAADIVVSESVYLPRCSDISEDEIDEGKRPKGVTKLVDKMPPELEEKEKAKEPVVVLEKDQKKSKKKTTSGSESCKEPVLSVFDSLKKSLTKRQQAISASKEVTSSSIEPTVVEDRSLIVSIEPVIPAEEDDPPVLAQQPTNLPKFIVPKILKILSPQTVSPKEGPITQQCSVRVEKLADSFVHKTHRDENVVAAAAATAKSNVVVTSEVKSNVVGVTAEAKTSVVSEANVVVGAVVEKTRESDVVNEKTNSESPQQKALPESTPVDKQKRRKRKANRTGFPTTKKKKKIIAPISGEITREIKTHKPHSRPPSVIEQHPQVVRSSSRLTHLQESEQTKPNTEEVPITQQEEPEQQKQQQKTQVVSKGKRGRPPKDDQPKPKRSKIYEEVDEEVDCLALLPVIESSGPSSGTQSSAETDDVIGGSSNTGDDDSNQQLKKRKKKKHKSTPGGPSQSPFKKNYLVAGLFSEFYKTDSAGNSESSSSKKSLSYNVNEHVHGLLPPPYYCGRQLRQKKEDFQLPYDLWWLHAHKQLPGRDVVATWNYKRIKNNVFYDVKPLANFEAQACHCRHEDGPPGCGEDCINRMTYSECDPRLCPLGDKCTNNQIQKHRGVTGLERFMTEEKGWGVRAKTGIQGGEFVMEYVGEVVSEKEFKLRMLTEYVDDTHHYCLHLDGGAVIDGHRMGGECRFVNHSCRPNCEMQKWTVNGLYRMALFTLRDIEPGEELTYDYNFSLFNPHEGQICRCGARDCRGVIGGRTQRINGLLGKVETTKPDSKQSQAVSSRESTSSSGTGGIENRGRDRKKILTVRRSEGSTVPTRALQLLAQVKPMSHQQRCFAQEHRCFLLRNLEKVRRIREKIQRKVAAGVGGNLGDETAVLRPEQMILTGLTALTTARSMQTRRLAIAQDDPNVTKVVKLAQLLREIFAQVTSVNDEHGKLLSRYFNALPSKKKHPLYLTLIPEPIDLQLIDRNINTGFYAQAEQFDSDLLKLFQNNLRYFGHHSPEGQASLKLRDSYNTIKTEYYSTLSEILGPAGAVCFIKKPEGRLGTDDDAISCVCGQYKDEGLMVQCEACHIWQHCDCVGHPEGEETFYCQSCNGPKVDLDIKLIPQPEYASPGETYYVSLLREKLQVRLGDTVYVLRAFKTPKDPESSVAQVEPPPKAAIDNRVEEKESQSQNLDEESKPEGDEVNKSDESGQCFTHGGIPHKMMSPSKGPAIEASSLTKGNYPTFQTVDPNISTDDMDIFRIERLWINEKGERFAFGHHYLRPHETFHEPNRKFFRNEVFRVPLYEVLPLDTIWGQCWVLDLPTFCKGRPLGSVEEHVYICEYRVDKSARLFNKISKPKYPICTKKFAFDHFDQRLKPSRIYNPHELPASSCKLSTPRSRSVSDDRLSAQSDSSHGRRGSSSTVATSQQKPTTSICRPPAPSTAALKSKLGQSKTVRNVALPAVAITVAKPDKLEATLQRLLSQVPVKLRLDASYLLEYDKRTRKRPVLKNAIHSKPE